MEYANTSWLRDGSVKRPPYTQAEIPEYWVVNLKRCEMVVLCHPEGEAYPEEITLRQGGVVPLGFPGLEVSVERLIEGVL